MLPPKLSLTLERYCIDSSEFFAWGPAAYCVKVPWKMALERWKVLYNITLESEFYPIMIGDFAAVSMHEDQLDIYQAHTHSLLTQGYATNTSRMILERLRERMHRIPRGTLPTLHTETLEERFFTLEVPQKRSKPIMHIALLPTTKGQELPAYLNFGGWQSCPPAVEHVAFWRHWSVNYGADPVILTGDVLEMRVRRPPKDLKQAYELAFEQYIYCENIVVNGLESIDRLAAALMHSPTWYFWWK